MTTIAPTDVNLVYSPYNWNLSGGVAYTVNTGATVKALISGAADLAATFDVSAVVTPAPRIAYRVDGGPWQDTTLAASIPITLPTARPWGFRQVELMLVAISQQDASHTGDYIKWASPWETRVAFTGFTSGQTIATTAAVAPSRIKGLFLGDSITEGIRTLNSSATAEVNRNDVRLTWAHIAADLLGADRGIVGFGSLGLVGAGRGGVPALPDSWDFLYEGVTRDVTTSPPDFVAIHIGTNDWSHADATVQAASTALINDVLSKTPASTRVIVLRNYAGFKATPIRDGMLASTSPARCTWVDTTGWFTLAESSDELHPYGSANLSSCGPRAATAIRTALNTGRTFTRNSAGVAVPI